MKCRINWWWVIETTAFMGFFMPHYWEYMQDFSWAYNYVADKATLVMFIFSIVVCISGGGIIIVAYLICLWMFSGVVQINEEGITRKLWLYEQNIPWAEVEEWGISKSVECGRLGFLGIRAKCIYFSTKRLTEEERYNFMINENFDLKEKAICCIEKDPNKKEKSRAERKQYKKEARRYLVLSVRYTEDRFAYVRSLEKARGVPMRGLENLRK